MEFQLDTDNKEFQDALQLITHTRQSVFLTGKAGTGKSTFVNVLIGLYQDDYTGDIFYDNINIHELVHRLAALSEALYHFSNKIIFYLAFLLLYLTMSNPLVNLQGMFLVLLVINLL